VVLDSVRLSSQVEGLRKAFGRQVIHVHLDAPDQELASRFEARKPTSAVAEVASYEELRNSLTEANIRALEAEADVVIDTQRCEPEDVEVRAACHLGLHGKDMMRLVDVLIGGQYGSEGKGNIAFHLAPEYDLLVRVGGPNAGHKVPLDEPYTHRLLPSGTRATEAPLLIGPGAVINVDVLLDEISASGVDVDRLSIDPQAMVITATDIKAEQKLVKEIGSTGQGVGEATARRIRGRRGEVGLARDVRPLRPYLVEARYVLEDAFSSQKRVLLEGTQGTALSLFHGDYPHVTSRDTTVSGCLAEAGVAPHRVRKVVMVCRTYPIRVQSPKGRTSGPMSQPIDWQTIADRSGIELAELERIERGSVSDKQRRVAEFDWALLRKASVLNGPTDIALTFVDYLDVRNREARRFEQLQPATIQFIEEVERVAGAPVSLISTRFHVRSVIDRRAW
jgi:adenylosuccinate synthase